MDYSCRFMEKYKIVSADSMGEYMTTQFEIRSVAVVLPTFNERNNIEQMVGDVSAFAAENPHYRFLFVDDASNDGTAEILGATMRGQKQSNISFFGSDKNRGKGNAVRTGLEKVEADVFCFIDSDLAYSLDHLKLLEEGLRTSDVVIGSRRLSPSKGIRPSLRRRMLGETFNRLARIILNLPFRDTQAGLKGFRFRAAQRIFAKSSIPGFGFDVELLFLARKFGYSISEVAVNVSDRHSYKKGKLKLMKDSVIMFFNLLLIRVRNFAGRYYD
jgi:dolichyl-phosphate beta-glucosyltransferase